MAGVSGATALPFFALSLLSSLLSLSVLSFLLSFLPASLLSSFFFLELWLITLKGSMLEVEN